MPNPLAEFKTFTEGKEYDFITPKEKERFMNYINSIKNKKKKRTEFKLIVKKYNSITHEFRSFYWPHTG